MSLDEIERAFVAYKGMLRTRAQFVYNEASLIVKGMSIINGSNDTYPEIHEAFPHLFDEEEIQKAKEQVQAEQFVAFANAWNAKFEESNNG